MVCVSRQSVECSGVWRETPSLRDQFLSAARIPAHPTDLDKTIEAVLDLLWYNVFATNDGIAKLGGSPMTTCNAYTGGRTMMRV